VYEALHDAGVEPDWVIGTSIGAIHAAIIAGNEPARRLERIRSFWDSVTTEPHPSMSWLFEHAVERNANIAGAAGSALKQSALENRLSTSSRASARDRVSAVSPEYQRGAGQDLCPGIGAEARWWTLPLSCPAWRSRSPLPAWLEPTPRPSSLSDLAGWARMG